MHLVIDNKVVAVRVAPVDYEPGIGHVFLSMSRHPVPKTASALNVITGILGYPAYFYTSSRHSVGWGFCRRPAGPGEHRGPGRRQGGYDRGWLTIRPMSTTEPPGDAGYWLRAGTGYSILNVPSFDRTIELFNQYVLPSLNDVP